MNLPEITRLFLKLGIIGFGGPAVHIAMMEKEVVRKKKWMDHQHFLDLVGATNLIPGPNSAEMTMHCGYERGGWKGLVLAGLSFILPAVAITSVFAWLYYQYGSLPDVKAFIYGIKPAVIAIIVTAMIPLGKKALKSVQLGILGALTLAACLLGLSEIIALFACGLMGIVLFFARKKFETTPLFAPLVMLTAGTSLPVMKIFWIFLKVGAILYGSGYVLFAFLDAELVSRELITRQELMDAIAVGQLTPGPILSSATFIGWQMGGFWGAMAATAGIFLPSFIFVALLNPVIPKLRRSGVMSAFLDAVNIASVAVILAVAVAMGKETVTDWRTIVIALASLGTLLVFKKLNSALVVLGGAVAGYLLLLI